MIDHVGDVVDVDAAGGDVGCDHDVLLARLERRHRALALLLTHVAVHAARAETAVAQLIDEPLRRTFRASEDDRLASTARLQDAADDLVLVERVCAVDDVLDVRLRESLIRIRRADVDRRRHESASQRQDGARHRRAEQLRVALGRHHLEDLLDVGQEAEIEHLVRLVEHDFGGVRQVQKALVREVDEATRRADDDLCAGLELVDLPLVRLAAVDRDDARGPVRGEHVHVFVHLHRELAGRDDDEGLHTGLRVLAETLHDGDAEAESLAGARLGLADHVLAWERERDRLLLNREGILDALGGQGIEDVLIDVEICETCHVCTACPAASAASK